MTAASLLSPRNLAGRGIRQMLECLGLGVSTPAVSVPVPPACAVRCGWRAGHGDFRIVVAHRVTCHGSGDVAGGSPAGVGLATGFAEIGQRLRGDRPLSMFLALSNPDCTHLTDRSRGRFFRVDEAELLSSAANTVTPRPVEAER